MATQFEIDCALMAGASYYDTRAEVNRFPIPDGWTKIIDPDSHFSDFSSGFEAVSFQNIANPNEIVISFAGTDPSDLLGDVAADIGLATGFGSAQLLQAAEYYLQVKAQVTALNPNATITLTGHSLGGGLAALMGVFFGEKAVTFDQAPFANSAQANSIWNPLTLYTPNVAGDLKDDLLLRGYQEDDLTGLTAFLQQRAAMPYGGIPNINLVNNIRVDGEFLSSAPLSVYDTIGTTTPENMLTHGPAGILSGLDLHSQALLTAFLQSVQSVANSDNPQQTLSEASKKLTGLLGMIFDKALFANETDISNTENVNFLEHLIRHQEGLDPSVPDDGDAMVSRFTSDLWKIAQDGGLTMANNDLTKALTAFAMQAYYFNRPDSNATLFDAETGGIHFDRVDVADTLDGDTGAKGYTMYFTNYLATLPANDRDLIVAQLPNLLDWYIQAGTPAMEATAGTQRAFMLGGSGADTLTGGSQADLLVGNGGKDILNGGAGADLMIGGEGIDTYTIDGNDTIRDTGRNFIVYQGQVIAGAFLREGTSNVYSFLGDNNFTLTFDSAAHLTVNGTDSITFEQQTSAAAFENGDFGITLYDQSQADWGLNGTVYRNEMSLLNYSGTNPENWLLVFTSFPNGTTENTPFYSKRLTAVAPQLEITGGVSGDFLFGFNRRDHINGGDGNDIIIGNLISFNGKPTYQPGTVEGDLLEGGAGNDWIEDSGGDDQIIGGEGDDIVGSFDGKDYLSGGGGNDVLAGGSQDDVISGGDGDDALFGDGYYTGNTTITLDNRDQFKMIFDYSGAANEGYSVGYTSVSFVIHDDVPEFGDDILSGGTGRDYINGGGGNDTLLGEASHDTLIGGSGDDNLDGGAGNDWLVGDDGDMTGSGSDTLSGGSGDDLLYGLGGNDILTGSSGNDDLYGDDGDDYLDGGTGEDWLVGGAGDDLYRFNMGNEIDIISDSSGLDMVAFGSGIAFSDISVFVRDGNDLVVGIGAGSDQLTFSSWYLGAEYQIDRFTFMDGTEVSGVEFFAILTGTSVLRQGSSGNDVLNGYGGVDNMIGAVGNDTLLGYGGYDALDGGSGNDFLDGGTGADIMYGRDDNDTLVGGDGNDMLDGGSGDDNLDGGADVDIMYGRDGNDTLVGGDGNDALDGDSGDDKLDGGVGDDSLYGAVGNDVLIGGTGSDGLYGGSGDDTYMFGRGSGWDTIDDGGMSDLDTLRLGEGLTYADLIVEKSAEDFYVSIRGSNDRLTVRNWLVSEENTLAMVKFADGTVWDTPYLINLIDTAPLFLRGSEGKDRLAGVSSADRIFGEDGNDTIYGRAGDDYLYGGNGQDSIYGEEGVDYLYGGNGEDYIEGGTGDDFLYGGDFYAVFDTVYGRGVFATWGDDQEDYLDGGSGSDTYYFNRGFGQDQVYDVQNYGEVWNDYEIDTIQFGKNIAPGDILVYRGFRGDLCLAVKNSDDLLTLKGYQGYNEIGNIERVCFFDGTVWGVATLAAMVNTSTEGSDRLYGSNKGETINGFGGDDFIYGYGGDDVLVGGAGDDSLEGGAGNDTLVGELGDDYFYGDVGDDILDGGAGNDVFEDGDGNDVFVFGRGYGQDRVYSWDEGLSFTDVIRFQPDVTPTDIVVSQVDDGSYDLVLSISGTDDTLIISGFFDPDYGQNLQIDAVEFADGTVWNVDKLMALASGVSGDVVITGTAGADILAGTAGNDTLQSGAGNDLLAGGDGNDIYIFNPGDGVDRIVDTGGTDTIQFGAGITPDSLSLGLGSLLVRVGDQGDAIHLEDFNPDDPFNSSVVEQFQFADGTVLGIGDLLARGFDIQGSDGDDLLTGTAITDRITGGEGNDTLAGGKGDDLLAGGGGNDTYVFNLGDGVETIADVSSATEGNLIAFGAGIAASDLVFERDGSDLLIHVGSQGDTVWLKDFDHFGNNGSLVVDTLQFADGSQASLFALTNSAPLVGVMVQNQMALEDAVYSFTIPAETFVDADGGDSLIYSATLGNGNVLPAWLIFDPATRTFSGMPTNGDVGMLDVTVMATDTAGASTIASFALNIANVNDAPLVAAQIPTQSAMEDAAFSFTIPVDAFTDVDAGDLLTYSASLADASVLPSWLSFDAVTRTFSGTPENGDVGTLNITMTATDSIGASVAQTFAVDVVNTNDAPMSMADVGFVGEDQTLLYSGNVLANDSDVDAGTTLSVTAPGEYVGRYGTLSIAADGGYTYSLNNASGDVQSLAQDSTVVDQFIYNVTDGIVTVSGQLDITVTGSNDAPVLAGDSAFLIEDMVTSASGNVLANDTDVDAGTTLTVADPATRLGSYGTLNLAADGSYAYSLDNASNTVQSLGRGALVAEHFSYTATDGIASVASAMDITLTGSNDAPILAAPLADQQVKFNKDFSWQMPTGSFVDPDQGDTLNYRATLADGSALPTWLSFDAATQTFSGRAPKQVGSVEVKVTATDKVAATGSTDGSFSTSDVFKITVSQENNGEDNCNDDSGHGTPGKHGGHDVHRSDDRDDDRSRVSDKARKGGEDTWGQPRREQPAYLNASHWDDTHTQEKEKSGAQVDSLVVFGRWLTMDLAVSKALAEKKTLSWLDEKLGADTTSLGKASAGFLGSTTPFGSDLFSLQAGHGQELKGFKGLSEGLRKVA